MEREIRRVPEGYSSLSLENGSDREATPDKPTLEHQLENNPEAKATVERIHQAKDAIDSEITVKIEGANKIRAQVKELESVINEVKRKMAEDARNNTFSNVDLNDTQVIVAEVKRIFGETELLNLVESIKNHNEKALPILWMHVKFDEHIADFFIRSGLAEQTGTKNGVDWKTFEHTKIPVYSFPEGYQKLLSSFSTTRFSTKPSVDSVVVNPINDYNDKVLKALGFNNGMTNSEENYAGYKNDPAISF